MFSRFLEDNAWDPTNGAINFTSANNLHIAMDNQTSDPPRSISAIPVYGSLGDTNEEPVGYLFSIISWEPYLMRIIPDSIEGIVVALKNSCSDTATYRFDNKKVSNRKNTGRFFLS